MEKWLKYFLSLCLLALFACQSKAPQKDQASLALKIQELETKRSHFYQGSKLRQAYADSLIALAPEVAKYYRGKSITHTKIGDYHIAFPLLEKAMALDTSDTGYYYGWLLLYSIRDYERAIQRLNEFDNLTPDQPDFAWGEHVNYLKGLTYRQLEQYEAAIAEFDRCIAYEQEAVDLYAYVYRGICYSKLKDFEKAIQDFQQAIEMYDKCSMAYYYMALAEKELGNKKAAIANWQTALDLVKQGYKKTDAYHEVFDAIHEVMILDQLAAIGATPALP